MDKVICVGKNYREHALEMQEPLPEKPVIFVKPPSVLADLSSEQGIFTFPLSNNSEAIHYECELVFEISQDGFEILPSDAPNFISNIRVGLDLTKRELQSELKKKGHPWTIAKVFPNSAIVGPAIPIQKNLREILTNKFSFLLNDVFKQEACGHEMLFGPYELICHVSQFFPICKGDLLFAGTPKGVGPLKKGDKGEIRFNGEKYLHINWV